jgi:hypothetical protein
VVLAFQALTLHRPAPRDDPGGKVQGRTLSVRSAVPLGG